MARHTRRGRKRVIGNRRFVVYFTYPSGDRPFSGHRTLGAAKRAIEEAAVTLSLSSSAYVQVKDRRTGKWYDDEDAFDRGVERVRNMPTVGDVGYW